MRAKALSALVVVLAVSVILGMMSMRFEEVGSEKPTSQAKNQTFYVAPDGDDAGPGTLGQPWRTIQCAADTLEPGDVVYIRGGVYEEYVELSRGGSYGNYVTYAAYPGETPILDGNNVDWKYGFNLVHESYIKIDGFVIRNWDGFGIVSWGQSDHIVIINVEIYNTETAIRLFDHHDDWLVENAYLHHNSLIGVDCAPGPGTNIVLRNVQSMYNGVGGDTAADGFAFESGNSILVEDCEASYNGGDGFDFKSDGTQLVRVIAHDNGRNNIKLWGENSRLINALSYDSGLTNLVLAEGGSYRVINCLVASRNSYGYLATLGGYDTSIPTPVVLYNNIFYNDNPVMGGTTVYFPAGATLTADNNIYWNPYRTDDVICAGFVGGCFSSDDINDGTWHASSGADANGAYADPLFVDATGKDFHLTAESPAVDAGNPDVAPNNDLEGISRPQGSGVDIGPYEMCGESPPAQDQKILPPEDGCYVGVFPGWGELEDSVSAQQLKDFEELSGRSVAISPFSNFWGENYVSRQQLDEMASYGAVPLLRLMPWGEPYWKPGYQPDYSLQKIIDGDFDQFISDWADEIKGYGKPVMVTFGVEMNGDWFPWSGVFQGGSTTPSFGDPQKADGPERYAAAYRHIIELFRDRGVKNVTWLFQPNAQSYPEEAWNSIQAYYPGDEYIDWVGVSLYGTQFIDENWYGFETLMDPAYNEITSLFPNKPLMLPEWGVGEWPDKGDKAAWYTEALTKLQSKYTLIKIAIVYHERWQNDDGTWSDLRINSSPEALNAYRNDISSDYFVDSYPTSNQLTLVMELDTNKYETGQQMNVALRLTNGGDSEVVLVFPTSQTFDFQVLDEGGKEVYRWSSERFFLAAITTVTLKPGETLERSLTWAFDLERGSYIVIGMTARFTADGSSTTLQTPGTAIQVTSSTIEYQGGEMKH